MQAEEAKRDRDRDGETRTVWQQNFAIESGINGASR